MIFGFPDLLEQEVYALLIWPPQLIHPIRDSVHFMVLPHWETRLPEPEPDIPSMHIILTVSQPVLALS